MPRKKTVLVPGRAVAYVRTSTDRQENSIEDQRHRIEQYAASRGWELAACYVDEGVSGAKAKRPALDALVRDVLADGVSHVVCTKLDRLGRSVRHVIELCDMFEAKGVGLVFIDQGIDTSTSSGKLLRNILASVAEFERDLISERVAGGMAEAKRKGVQFGKRSTLPEDVRQRIWNMRQAGTPYNRIATILNAEAVPTGQGGACWYASSVKKAVESIQAGQENA